MLLDLIIVVDISDYYKLVEFSTDVLIWIVLNACFRQIKRFANGRGFAEETRVKLM